MKKKKLDCRSEVCTAKQEKFCQEYVSNGNRREDALIAAGYSKTTAKGASHKVWKLQKVHDRIKELMVPLTMGIQKKLVYHAYEGFENLNKAQKLALEKQKVLLSKGLPVGSVPDADLASFIKAEELKLKLSGHLGNNEGGNATAAVLNIIRHPNAKGGTDG